MRSMVCRAAVVWLAAAAPAMAGSHPFTAQDLWSMDRVSSPQVSPDRRHVAFVVRRTDFAADRGTTDIWIVAADGGEARQLTRDSASDFSPLWTPEGRVVFLSTRSGSSQIWMIDPDGGEAESLTELALGVSNPTLAPDGSRIAFTLDVFVDCETIECTVKRLEERSESKASGRVYEELFVRHWDTWKDGRRSHLFTLDLTDAGAEPVEVTPGVEGDVPSKPFGGAEEVTFTPDGRKLVFTMREGGGTEAWSTDFDLYVVPSDGSAAPTLLTADNPAWDTQPVFSPDGETLAYLAMERPGYESDRFRLILRDWPTGNERVLAAHWDRSIGSHAFAPDGATIYVTARDIGEVKLFAIEVESGVVTQLIDGGHVRSPVVAGERLIFGMDDLMTPVELYSMALDGSDRRSLTSVNAERMAELELGPYEQFSFAGWNDEVVWGYVVEPVDRQPGRRYPFAFIVHGGPQGSSGSEFHYRWNPQVYAGAGYAVVMVDFHGSTGYGQAFTDSINEDWGGKPLEDLRKGLAAALERYSWIDGDRGCALGASYGGYMMNWIAGNWVDGFNCLVTHDGVFDNRMMYFETEELWFPEWDHGGTYWDNRVGHERHNPALFVDRWRTPMLVIQGELDYRVPVSQGLGAFTALQRQGIPSRLLYFPDENHWVLSPANGLLWHEEVLGWLDRWTAPGDGNGVGD